MKPGWGLVSSGDGGKVERGWVWEAHDHFLTLPSAYSDQSGLPLTPLKWPLPRAPRTYILSGPGVRSLHSTHTTSNDIVHLTSASFQKNVLFLAFCDIIVSWFSSKSISIALNSLLNSQLIYSAANLRYIPNLGNSHHYHVFNLHLTWQLAPWTLQWTSVWSLLPLLPFHSQFSIELPECSLKRWISIVDLQCCICMVKLF